ncbi:MAG: hypothetical protein HYX68_13135 [Planctomycetes bacterium]|jgi:hypothetical protein|nr:hypothetical protein [Planctomycetota bacterium]
MADSYQVVYSHRIKVILKDLKRIAASEGREPDFIQVLQEIDQLLRNEPDVFGEPLYSLVHVQVRHGIRGFVVVCWAVHDQKKTVFLKDYRFLPGP